MNFKVQLPPPPPPGGAVTAARGLRNEARGLGRVRRPGETPALQGGEGDGSEKEERVITLGRDGRAGM